MAYSVVRKRIYVFVTGIPIRWAEIVHLAEGFKTRDEQPIHLQVVSGGFPRSIVPGD